MKLANIINNINLWVGKAVSFFMFPIIGVILFEVVMRYFLHKSQLWVSETSVFFFGAMFVLGGGYVLYREGHVRMDVLYSRFSKKGKAVADIVTSIFAFIFCFALVYKSWPSAWGSLITMERSASAWAPYLFPIRMTIPIGAALLMLQLFSRLIQDILTLTKRSQP